MLVLGIETSCDDTAAAVVRRSEDGACQILSNEVWAQHEDHAAFGGVVPEIAARSHVERLDGTIERAVTKAGVSFAELDAVAATAGPGLVGGVLVGLTTAKAVAMAHGRPGEQRCDVGGNHTLQSPAGGEIHSCSQVTAD